MYLLTNVPYHNYYLPYTTKTCIIVWKLETTAQGNFVYVSPLKQQGNSNFEFISVSFTLGYIGYQHTVSLKLYDLKIESFCFLLKAVSTLKTNISTEKKIILVCFYH